jgi:hypothetical protein
VRLAIADPPYLGRSARWYGDGRGHFTRQRNSDHHPDASMWDDPVAHRDLVRSLVEDYDGWAIAGAPDSLAVYLEVCPADTRVLVWHRGNAIPSGSRVAEQWEFVLAYIPEQRRGREQGLATSDVLHRGVDNRSGFTGSKPPEWTRWLLAVLGYDPAVDTVADLFPGSGRVAAAAAVLA